MPTLCWLGQVPFSLLPALLPQGMGIALKTTHACRTFLCNLLIQSGETDDLSASDHLASLIAHLGPRLFDFAVVNTRLPSGKAMPKRNETGISHGYTVGEPHLFLSFECLPVIGRWLTREDQGFDEQRLQDLVWFLYQERLGNRENCGVAILAKKGKNARSVYCADYDYAEYHTGPHAVIPHERL